MHVNDDGLIVESDTSNDLSCVSFSLRRDSNGNPKITLISHSACSSPTGHICEWQPYREVGSQASAAPADRAATTQPG